MQHQFHLQPRRDFDRQVSTIFFLPSNFNFSFLQSGWEILRFESTINFLKPRIDFSRRYRILVPENQIFLVHVAFVLFGRRFRNSDRLEREKEKFGKSWGWEELI